MPSVLKKSLLLKRPLVSHCCGGVRFILAPFRRSSRLLAPLLLLATIVCLIFSTALTSSASASAAVAPPLQPQGERQDPVISTSAIAPQSAMASAPVQPRPNSVDDMAQQQQHPAVAEFIRQVSEVNREDSNGELRTALQSKLPLLNLLAAAAGQGASSLTDRAKACPVQTGPPLKLHHVQNFAYVHNEPDLCTGQLFLLTAVHSNAKNANRRATIRRTWGSLRYVGASRLQLVFFLARPNTQKLQASIDAESRRYRDIVQVDYLEHYRNMSLKHLSIYEWMILHCQSAQYLVKVDDDTFADVVHLVAFLQHSPPDGFYCSNTRGAKPQRSKHGPKAKWAVSRAEFSASRYPAYCEGFGYALRASHLPSLYLCSLFSKFFWIDDVYVTGVLAAAAKVPLTAFWAGHSYTGQLPSMASEKILDYIFLVADHNEFLEVVWHRLWRSVLQYSLDLTL